MSKINNNLFGGLSSEKLAAVSNAVVKDSPIRLCSTYLTPAREVVPICEALVAYNPEKDEIVKFISAFVPGYPGAAHQGVKFMISKNHQDGSHRPVVVKNKPGQSGFYWNEVFQTAYLDYGKLPATIQSEFRVLRAYRQGIRTRARFELLSFDHPAPGQPVDKRTMKVEQMWNGCPPIALAQAFKGLFWWQEMVVNFISQFSGVDLTSCLGLGIARTLASSVSPAQLNDLLHDHSEEVSEPLSVTFGGVNMVTPEEGKPFYAPEIPVPQAEEIVEVAPTKKKRKASGKASGKRKVKVEQSIEAAGEVEIFD